MRFLFKALTVLVSFVSLVSMEASALAADVPWSRVIPDDHHVLAQLTDHVQTTQMPNTFNMLIWNTHKGADGDAWRNDFLILARDTQLILLQEAMNDSFMPEIFNGFSHMEFSMAQSFIYKGSRHSTGVVTGAAAQPEQQFWRRSPDREPILATPKMALLSQFQLANGSQLLVVNIHAINFVTTASFRRQIEDLEPYIMNFPGDVVFGGDFNTWSPGRLSFLLEKTAAWGLSQVNFIGDERHLPFDHLFVRNCKVEIAMVYMNVETSDHEPLKAQLSCQ